MCETHIKERTVGKIYVITKPSVIIMLGQLSGSG